MKKYLFAAAVAIVLFISPDVWANLLVEHGKISMNVTPGQSATGFVSVHNTSQTNSLNLRVYWQDFEYVEPFNGKKDFLAAGTSRYSLSQWITFSPHQVTLAPLTKRDIAFSIKVPENAQGGYYGVLFFESGAQSPQGDIGVRIVSRVGSLFFIEIEPKDKQADISNWKRSKAALRADFSNEGNVIMIPEASYFILDDAGIAVGRGLIEKFYLPPGKTQPFEIPLQAMRKEGRYTIVLTFDLGDGVSLVRELAVRRSEGKVIVNKISQ